MPFLIRSYQDAVEPVELDRLVRDIEVEMVSLGHA